MNDRLDVLIALSVKNHKTPNTNTYIAFARHVLTAKYGCSPATMKSDLETVISAWNADHWKTLVENNPYLDGEETRQWITTH